MTCPSTTEALVKRIQSSQPVCWLGGFGVVSRGKMRCQFHFPFGGRSSTISGRTTTASSIQMCLRQSASSE
jgi:hypothetical protein